MRHLSRSESPRYVSDRLSAVSNVPMQFLVSAGVVATIFVTASLAGLMPKKHEAARVDAQTTASVVRVTQSNSAAANSCHHITVQTTAPRALIADERS